ncbi:hypothetical protein [Streptomyces sp. NPDC090445]|uniref:hypothetical protein n=1 Tax=Streptomyces sp. NPDC090445 TaxID=3365963 RepID=UPI00381816FD
MLELDVEKAARIRGLASPAPQDEQAVMIRIAVNEELPLKAQRKISVITYQGHASRLMKCLAPTVEHSDVEVLGTRDQAPAFHLQSFVGERPTGIEPCPFGYELSLTQGDAKASHITLISPKTSASWAPPE